MLPIVADGAESQQFLAEQRCVLSPDGLRLFLRALYGEYAAALRTLIRNTEGNFSPDEHAAALPPKPKLDSGATPAQLRQAWIEGRKPADGTLETWRYILRDLEAHFSGRSAASITEAEAREWLEAAVNSNRSRRTVAKNWKRAAQAVFAHGVESGRIASNPFAAITMSTEDGPRTREEKSFTADEQRTILEAALAITKTERPIQAAKRWVPWLCAYSGARPGEIAQLRGQDVAQQDGAWVVRLTPDAGTIKNKRARSVPVHGHLIEQGFIEWVRAKGAGPLFYRPRTASVEADPLRRKKAPAAQVRQRLADWVRAIGVTDPELSPNHAWRHTFKVIGRRASIPDKWLDDICGHAPPSEGRAYGPTPLEDKVTAITRFPRYHLTPSK